MDKKDSGMYVPKGDLSGDKKPMPDKGTSTGVTDTYGADIGVDSTNSMSGGMAKATRSDGKEPA